MNGRDPPEPDPNHIYTQRPNHTQPHHITALNRPRPPHATTPKPPIPPSCLPHLDVSHQPLHVAVEVAVHPVGVLGVAPARGGHRLPLHVALIHVEGEEAHILEGTDAGPVLACVCVCVRVWWSMPSMVECGVWWHMPIMTGVANTGHG